jgi:Zn-dependent protease with chaperone function
VPLPEEETRQERPGLRSAAPPSHQALEDEDASAGYVLAGGVAKKAKAVAVREGFAHGVRASAAGVREAAAPTQRSRTAKEILAAFDGEIEPFRPSFMYSLWLLITAGFMVLLPLIYLALVGLVIFALGYHAIIHISIFQHLRGRGPGTLALLLYVIPLICGIAIVAFMFKPFFAKPAKQPKRRTLDPEVEPLLFAFIDGICATVGAPRPDRIDVDCTVNAAAGFSGGSLSLATREPFVEIGLGLVPGLDLKQFAGIMAHELGHLSQGSGARVLELVVGINAWFGRVAFERDAWDETLYAWSKSENSMEMVVGMTARGAVWLVRRVLWALFYLGYLISMGFVRQKEYDADRYEARMVGSAIFERSCLRLRELHLASEFAMSNLETSWHQRRMPDNLPKLILANVPQIPKELLAQYRKATEEVKTGLFDTHPSDRDRIAPARVDAPTEGIFDLDGPATDVFRNFDSLARAATFDHYKSTFGLDISSDQLYTVAELVETEAAAQEGYVAADRFFLNALPILQKLPLRFDRPKAPADPKAAKQSLLNARADQQAARDACLAATEREKDVYVRLFKAETATILLKADIKIDAKTWELRAPTSRAAESAREKAEAEIRQLDAQLQPYAAAIAQRLTQALAILEVEAAVDRVPQGRDRREEARALYPCVAHLAGNVVHQLLPVVRARQILAFLLDALNGVKKSDDNTVLINAILRAAGDLHTKLESLRWKVGDTIYYPFEHAKEDVTLASYALPRMLPQKEDVGALLQVTDMAIDSLLSLYRRALGRLTVTAEEVERALKLPLIAVAKASKSDNAPGDLHTR